MNPLDLLEQHRVLLGSRAGQAFKPCVKATLADVEDAQHDADLEQGGVTADESEPHWFSLTKRPSPSGAALRGKKPHNLEFAFQATHFLLEGLLRE